MIVGTTKQIIFMSHHCRQQLVKRGITIEEFREVVRTGKVVFERPGVSKIVGDNICVIYGDDNGRVFTVFRPYRQTFEGNIESQTGEAPGGVVINSKRGDFYMSKHTENVVVDDRKFSLRDIKRVLNRGRIIRERRGVKKAVYRAVEVVFNIDTHRIFTVHRKDNDKPPPKFATPLPYDKPKMVM